MTRTSRGAIGAAGFTLALSGLIAFVGNPFGGSGQAGLGGGSGSVAAATQIVDADSDISPHAIISQAAAGEYAFRALHDGVYWDIGASTNDRIYASNGTIIANSWRFGDITVETIGSVQGYVTIFSPTPFPGGSLTACSSGRKGALQTLSGDGRIYQCDGTANNRMANNLSASASLDFGTILTGASGTSTMTVTGAASGDAVVCNPTAALSSGVSVAYSYVSASNTVTVTENFIGAVSIDPAAVNFICMVTR